MPCIHAPKVLQSQDSPKVPGKPRGYLNLLPGWGNLGASRVPAPTSAKSTGSDLLKVRAELAKGTNELGLCAFCSLFLSTHTYEGPAAVFGRILN